eukprot:263578-Chlamydomonas_euryale.AAC.4
MPAGGQDEGVGGAVLVAQLQTCARAAAPQDCMLGRARWGRGPVGARPITLAAAAHWHGSTWKRQHAASMYEHHSCVQRRRVLHWQLVQGPLSVSLTQTGQYHGIPWYECMRAPLVCRLRG